MTDNKMKVYGISPALGSYTKHHHPTVVYQIVSLISQETLPALDVAVKFDKHK